MRDLLEALVMAAHRGANIARASRELNVEPATQEKGEGENNPRFEHDFKTLVDVLVQESMKRDLISKFPVLEDQVLGEESNTFRGANGESVCVELYEDESATSELLETLVDTEAAKVLAHAAHEPVPTPDLSSLPADLPELDLKDVGIWIDPIDCTNEFIRGTWGDGPDGSYELWMGQALRGLPCVTILVGAFLRSTGEPIVGVIDQPFFSRKHKSRTVWGVCYAGVRCCSLGEPAPNAGTLLVSGVEGTVVVYRLMSAGFLTAHPPGAGLKLLLVALGESDAFVLSRDTSYRWDTCGPHAILRALGGDVVTFTPPHGPLQYHREADSQKEEGVQRFCNRGGIIAYRNPEILDEITEALYNPIN